MKTVISAVPSAEDVERAENLTRMVRVFSSSLGLSGHLAAWAGGGGNADVLADVDTLIGTLADLRALVTDGAA